MNRGEGRAISSRRQVWLEARGIDLDVVETTLLEDDSVEDCAVVARETKSSDTTLVAYVVASGSFSPEWLRDHLRARLPEAMLPSAYVPVSALPLTPSGEIDEQALDKLVVDHDQLIRRWEEYLQSLPDVENAAVVVEELHRRLPPLHLDDLLPERVPASATTVAPDVATDRSDAVRQEGQLVAASALADGGPLDVPAGAPTTLTEAILRTATEDAEKGITYVRSDGSETFQSYAALLDQAKRILAGLQERGLRPGDRVILQVDALEDHYPAFWACVLGGIAPVTVAVAPSYAERNGVVDKLFNAWELLGHPPVLTSRHLVEPIAGLTRLLPMDGLPSSRSRSSRTVRRPAASITADPTTWRSCSSRRAAPASRSASRRCTARSSLTPAPYANSTVIPPTMSRSTGCPSTTSARC